MTRAGQIAQLETLSQMILDLRLSELNRAARAREESLEHLRALEVGPAQDVDPITAAQVNLRYQTWADARRAEINLILARQIVDCAQKKASAQEAFARSEAVRLLRGQGL